MMSILADQQLPRILAQMRGEGGSCGVSANEYSCTHGAQINFGDLTPYLTYAEPYRRANSPLLRLWFYPSGKSWTNKQYRRHQGKMSSSKKLPCKGTMRQVSICLRPPPLLLYTCILYTVLFIHTGRGGGGLNYREGQRGNGSQSWVGIRKYQHE